MQGGSSVGPPFLHSIMAIFVTVVGWLSLTTTTRWQLLNKQIDAYGIKGIRATDRHVLQFACWNLSLVVVWCVCLCLLRVISWLIVWLRRGTASFSGASWEKWEDQEVEVSFICEPQHLCLSRAHCLLTVRRCSSVDEQLSWLDCNGKHKVRLVTKHRMGFFFIYLFIFTRNVSRTVWKLIFCMTRYWACLFDTVLLVVFNPGHGEIS